ncbi:hypothetical protein BRADI_4g07685v3 [Brachypodium distachyon]|uniref:Secreted protein n=1 Tax=Brachypodium distachyon TaxID=15368 RepID=A0A2K2CL39_BRADI|nr:hypothetical protein BRADI_4g07685v3 [Brachypodium distachyon]
MGVGGRCVHRLRLLRFLLLWLYLLVLRGLQSLCWCGCWCRGVVGDLGLELIIHELQEVLLVHNLLHDLMHVQDDVSPVVHLSFLLRQLSIEYPHLVFSYVRSGHIVVETLPHVHHVLLQSLNLNILHVRVIA